MKFETKTTRYRMAFSLVEVIIALTMASMIMITSITIYSQVRKSAEKVKNRLGGDTMAEDVLQLIAEDIDKLSASGDRTRITINNKIEKGINKSQMAIRSYVYDNNNRSRIYEEVIWQSYYDDFDEKLYLYRSHGGVALEDSMLDKVPSFQFTVDEKMSQQQLQEKSKEMFIPVCSGMSVFEFSIPQGPEKDPLYRWASANMPNAITASISFADPIEDVFGDYIIPAEDMYSRTVATNRTRKILFQFVRKEFEPDDPNDLLDGNNNDPNSVEVDIRPGSTGKGNTEELLEAIKGASSE